MSRTIDMSGVPAIPPFKNLTEQALSGIRQIYEEVPPTRDTLSVLFAIDAAQTEPTEAWVGYLVETACAQIVWDERPTGTLSRADADWVLARFDEAPSIARLALLVRMVEEAPRAPDEFPAEVRRRAALFSSIVSNAARTRPTSVPYLRLVA